MRNSMSTASANESFLCKFTIGISVHVCTSSLCVCHCIFHILYCGASLIRYNSKSGGQKALTLIKYFKAYTSSLFDLLALNQSEVIRAELAKDLIRYQHMVVVCPVGGDGSQCWAASLIDKCIAEHSVSYYCITPQCTTVSPISLFYPLFHPLFARFVYCQNIKIFTSY